MVLQPDEPGQPERSPVGGAPGVFPPGYETMELLANRTGGEVYINTNGISGAIQDAVDDSELVYTLAFYPSQEEQDGALHKLKVKIDRKGVTARYRDSYYATKAEPATPSSQPISSTTPSPSSEKPPLDLQGRSTVPASATVVADVADEQVQGMEELLKDSLEATQIELAAKALADPAEAGSYKVRVSVNLHDVKFERTGASWFGEFDIGFLAEGSEAFRIITRKLEIPDKQLAPGLDQGTMVETSIKPVGEPGRLRIVVRDHATGAAGSLTLSLPKP